VSEFISQLEPSGLQRLLESFEHLLKTSEDLLKKTKKPFGTVTFALSELYAMMTAFRIRAFLGLTDRTEIGDSDRQHTEDDAGPRRRLPTHEVVKNAVPVFISAMASRDEAAALRALEEMGVLDLCPTSEGHFSRMELVAASVSGRCHVIPLVELSLFAAEIGEYRRASQYALDARAAGPGSWEAYSLCLVDGLVAFDIGNVGEAIECLCRSTAACQTDEHASTACGIHALNLSLAQKLLEHGERVEVLMHLSECKNVWQYLRPQIDEWIGLIEKGEKPDFQGSDALRAMNEPAIRLRMQQVRAWGFKKGLPEAPRGSIPRKSMAGVLAARARKQAGFRPILNALIEKKLETWWRKQVEEREENPGKDGK
jgi:hypothetical protein